MKKIVSLNENKDTKFPENSIHNASRGWMYQSSKVDDWFKRCIEDFPKQREDELFSVRYMLLGLDAYRWFTKWFSQFRNKSDEND